MANTSTIHIKTDFDCKVFDYGQELGMTKADTYSHFEFRKGEHELTFAFTEYESISKTISYNVEDVDCDYRLVLEIAESICNKAQELYESKDYSHAFYLFQIATEKGLPAAQNGLGNCYLGGKGVEKNLNKAADWYTYAAEQGNANAQYNLGLFFYLKTAENDDEFIKWFTKAANQGHAKAQYSLGVCYEYGYGVRIDLAKATELYTLAAERGVKRAQCNLGVCYIYGNGVEKSITKAVEWFKKAATQGDTKAQCNLGICYKNGYGVIKDLNKALEWLSKAAEQDDSCALNKLGYCYEFGIGVQPDLSKAKKLYGKTLPLGGDHFGSKRLYELRKNNNNSLYNQNDYDCFNKFTNYDGLGSKPIRLHL